MALAKGTLLSSKVNNNLQNFDVGTTSQAPVQVMGRKTHPAFPARLACWLGKGWVLLMNVQKINLRMKEKIQGFFFLTCPPTGAFGKALKVPGSQFSHL